jgi:hypothetical protein
MYETLNAYAKYQRRRLITLFIALLIAIHPFASIGKQTRRIAA